MKSNLKKTKSNIIINIIGLDRYYLLRQLSLYFKLAWRYKSLKKIKNFIRCEYEFLTKKEMSFMAIDPICKMTVNEKTAKWTSKYRGKTYYFCAPGCKAEFDKNPEKYV